MARFFIYETIKSMGDHKWQAILMSLGIIHMLLEWVLGKRAAVNGGPGSIISLIAMGVRRVYSFIRGSK